MTGKFTCSCCSHAKTEPTKKKCPVCGGLSPAVGAATVRAILKKEVKVRPNGDFSICVNPACSVSYFIADKNWTLKDVSVSFDFKHGAVPRYACYCNNLTYAEVAATVQKSGLTTWAEVVKEVKGRIKPSKCAEKNPFGICCSANSFISALKEVRR